MNISIVMAYHNRKQQLSNTLESINHSITDSTDNIEIIIVDDASTLDHSIENLKQKEYKFSLFVHKIELKDKTWTNPCVPFNIGFNKAKGDVIVIQNPECLHLGNIIEDLKNRINEETYITYAAYSINQNLTNRICALNHSDPFVYCYVDSIVKPFSKLSACANENCWYNHSVFRPSYYHFCSVITRKNLIDKLKGFDQIYANGLGYDDDDFVERIKKLGLKMCIVDDPLVVHQWHYYPGAYIDIGKQQPNLVTLNERLFNRIHNNVVYR